MTLIDFINYYQTLIGAFLGVVFPIGFGYIAYLLREYRARERQIKLIENVFWIAVRESQEAYDNVEGYVAETRNRLRDSKIGFNLIIPPSLCKVYISEERLSELKAELDFGISQQIDIGISAGKVLNNFLRSVEIGPQMIFENTLRLLESGVIQKDQALREYVDDSNLNLSIIESELLKKKLLIAQRHLFRPIAAIAHKNHKNFWKLPYDKIDQILDVESEAMLFALKKDFKRI